MKSKGYEFIGWKQGYENIKQDVQYFFGGTKNEDK